jgi:hypothetical protein
MSDMGFPWLAEMIGGLGSGRVRFFGVPAKSNA